MNDKNYKIGKDKVQRFIKLNPEDVNMGGWESPIAMATKRLSSEIAKKTDETIWNAVLETNVKVDKEELIKALKYDREQYSKGYIAGYEDAYLNLPRWARKIFLRRMKNDHRRTSRNT